MVPRKKALCWSIESLCQIWTGHSLPGTVILDFVFKTFPEESYDLSISISYSYVFLGLLFDVKAHLATSWKALWEMKYGSLNVWKLSLILLFFGLNNSMIKFQAGCCFSVKKFEGISLLSPASCDHWEGLKLFWFLFLYMCLFLFFVCFPL